MHVDFAGPINGVVYLALVDSHSKWPEVISLSSINTAATISAPGRIFMTHGFSEALMSDSGTQFYSSQFGEYYRQGIIDHISTPPYHPQSNGHAERFVDTFKRVLLKAEEGGATEDAFRQFLFTYRTTPHPMVGGESPPELLT